MRVCGSWSGDRVLMEVWGYWFRGTVPVRVRIPEVDAKHQILRLKYSSYGCHYLSCISDFNCVCGDIVGFKNGSACDIMGRATYNSGTTLAVDMTLIVFTAVLSTLHV